MHWSLLTLLLIFTFHSPPYTHHEGGVEGGKEETKRKEKKKPVVCIIMGMAGSGKTTLLQRLNLYTAEKGIKSYFINLDPAVKHVPFGASIDIRDTVNYKEVRRNLYICASAPCVGRAIQPL